MCERGGEVIHELYMWWMVRVQRDRMIFSSSKFQDIFFKDFFPKGILEFFQNGKMDRNQNESKG